MSYLLRLESTHCEKKYYPSSLAPSATLSTLFFFKNSMD